MTPEHPQSPPPTNASPGDPLAAFAARPASTAWERVESPPAYFWLWMKPANVPHGLVLRIPDEVYQQPQAAAQFTLRRLLNAAGIDPRAVAVWHLRGVPYDAMNGTNPYLDAPLPPPAPGVDPNVVVQLRAAPVPGAPQPPPPNGPPPGLAPAMPPAMSPHMPAMMPPAQMLPPAQLAGAAAASLPADANLNESFERMEADWSASLEIEKELVRLRKQFIDLIGRLKSLNRDLNPDERRHSDNQDKKDWLDARRGLRDGSLRLWRCIKELDMGDMSFAGRKQWLEQLYEQHVLPRRPFEAIQQARREFEQHRKLVQTMQSNMNTAYSIASIEGERRAQQILARIGAKVRDAQTKKNFLGLMLD